MQNKDENRYNYMLNLPHHQSDKRPHMTLHDRAAQFSPFRALTGFEASIDETARLTKEKPTLHEDITAEIDGKLNLILDNISDKPKISVRFFKADSLKEGGSYENAFGYVKKIDEIEKVILLTDGRAINIRDILDLELL